MEDNRPTLAHKMGSKSVDLDVFRESKNRVTAKERASLQDCVTED